MENKFVYKTNSNFESVTYDSDSDSWHFSFTERIFVFISGFWRLLVSNKVKFVSTDNGHYFGKENPLDLTYELPKLLKNKKLIEIQIDKDTSDLILNFSENVAVQILISSIGYETFNLKFKDKEYIGLGSSKLEIIDGK